MRPNIWSASYAKAQAGAKQALAEIKKQRDLEFIQRVIGTCLTRQHRHCYRCPTLYDGSDWFFELDEADKIEGLVCPDCR